tara:strand:- start:87 stop:584 length:498 start_codon:yes stop_codon:yes gene_type:complete
MNKLFIEDYKTFDKPEIYWIFGHKYGGTPLVKHYVYGYRKHKNKWYIKVKNLVDNMSNTKRAKLRYEWQIIEPKHIDKDKNWLIKMAINHKIAKLDKTIKDYEDQLSYIPKKIEEIKKMKLKVTREEYQWNSSWSIDSNLEKGVEPLCIKDNVQKYYANYGTLSF